MSFLSSKSYTAIFGSKKEESKSKALSPAPNMFSGLSVRSTNKPKESEKSSEYVPPQIPITGKTSGLSDEFLNTKSSSQNSSFHVSTNQSEDVGGDTGISVGDPFAGLIGVSNHSESDVTKKSAHEKSNIVSDTKREHDEVLNISIKSTKSFLKFRADETEETVFTAKSKKVNSENVSESSETRSINSEDLSGFYLPSKKITQDSGESPKGFNLPTKKNEHTEDTAIRSSYLASKDKKSPTNNDQTNSMPFSLEKSKDDGAKKIFFMPSKDNKDGAIISSETATKPESAFSIQLKEKKVEPKKDNQENTFAKMIEDKKKKELEEKNNRAIQDKLKHEKEQREREIYGNSELLKEMIKNKLNEFSSLIRDKTKEQERIKDQQTKLAQEILESAGKIKVLEESEDRAAANEDFEAADNFHQEIELLNSIIETNHTIITDNSGKYSDLESVKSRIYVDQQNWIKETTVKSNKYKKEFEDNLMKLKNEHERNSKEKQENFQIEREMVVEKENELKIQESEARESQQILQEKIDDKTQSLKADKDKLDNELSEINIEIENLQRLLKEKTELAKGIRQNLSQAEAKLFESMQEFEDELSYSQSVQAEIATKLTELQDYQHELTINEKQFSQEAEKTAQTIEEKNNQLEIFEDCTSLLKTENERLDGLVKAREECLKEISESESLLQEKERVLKDAQEYFNVNKQQSEALREKLRQGEEKTREIGLKIPGLEAEKKTAAASKQFKEAARLANEIKDLISEQSLREEILDDLRKELFDQLENLKTIERTEEEIRGELIKQQTVLEQAKVKLLHSDEIGKAGLE